MVKCLFILAPSGIRNSQFVIRNFRTAISGEPFAPFVSPFRPVCRVYVQFTGLSNSCPVCPVCVQFTGHDIEGAPARSPNFRQYSSSDEIFQVAGSGPDGYTTLLAKIPIGDLTLGFDKSNGLPLPLVEIEPGQHLVRQPVAPEG